MPLLAVIAAPAWFSAALLALPLGLALVGAFVCDVCLNRQPSTRRTTGR